MNFKIWLRCLLVSAITCAAVPPLTMIALAPANGEPVVDLRSVDPHRLETLSKQDFQEYAKTLPVRRVHGLERVTYWFTHPQWLQLYWRAVITWFGIIFAATSIVSFLNTRDNQGAQSG
jgi:hypothetical protein